MEKYMNTLHGPYLAGIDNLVEEKKVDTMKIQASLWVTQAAKGIFDSLGGFWADANMHSYL